MDDYLNYLKHYPAYSKEDIRYYNTLSKHKRIIEHEEHLWKELTDAWVWKECWGDFDSVEESINMSKKMQLYYNAANGGENLSSNRVSVFVLAYSYNISGKNSDI
jgi:hypothetical protein|tara:strand:+ start:341 stop:655 length:315 start_codon:yes stop_codon:yes gene_type:complete